MILALRERVIHWLCLCAALAAAPVCCGGAGAAETEPPPQIPAIRVAAPPVIDGRLDESAWDGAPPITGFRQREPDEGELMTEQTTVRFLYDRSSLYIGIRCYQDPDGIIARTMVRDEPMLSDDVVSIRFDSFNDERNAFQFAINPLGNKVDALVEGGV